MRRFLILIPALLAVAACDMMESQTRPDEDEMTASAVYEVPGREVLWEVTVMELEKAGFQLDLGASDEHAGLFETHWVDTLAPHRYEGKRKKVLGRIVEDEERPGSYRILMTTWSQKNADIKEPMDPSRAVWQDEEPNEGQTEQLLYRIRQHFE